MRFSQVKDLAVAETGTEMAIDNIAMPMMEPKPKTTMNKRLTPVEFAGDAAKAIIAAEPASPCMTPTRNVLIQPAEACSCW